MAALSAAGMSVGGVGDFLKRFDPKATQTNLTFDPQRILFMPALSQAPKRPARPAITPAVPDGSLHSKVGGSTPFEAEPPVIVDPPPNYFLGPQEIGDEEVAMVTQALRSGNLFRYLKKEEDSFTFRFENEFRKATGVEHALAVNSGTSALICALVGLGVSSGDEVIVPAYTYIATAAAVMAVRGIPVIAEIDNSLTLDPADVERKITPRTKAIIPVHMRGTPSRMDEIMKIARKHNLTVLEDCAQANGGLYKGKPLGSIGHAGAFSLQQFKIITAGEGGAFVTDDKTVYERGCCYHDGAYEFWCALDNRPLGIVPFIGENYRMSDLNGALALAQLGKRERILARLRQIKKQMKSGLEQAGNIEFQDVPDADGDCSISVVFFMETEELAKQVAAKLQASGMRATNSIPDRHFFNHWHYVLEKRSSDLYGHPWTDAARPCQVEYSQDMCPQSADYLSRHVNIALTQSMSEAHVDSCIRVINHTLSST